MALYTYDAKRLLVNIGGVPISGFADGAFVEITANGQQFSQVVGADGITTRVKSNDYGAVMTLTLSQTSPSNDVLSGFLLADRTANLGVFPVLIKDLEGNTLIFSATAWIQQFPDITYSNEISNRAWSIAMADVDLFIAGSDQQG